MTTAANGEAGIARITNATNIARTKEHRMFGLNQLRQAIARLTGSLNALADTADAINVNVRQQFALDRHGAVIEAPALPMAGNPPGIAQDGTSDASTAAGPPAAKNGRRRAAAAE
jgi:hypothetical protein